MYKKIILGILLALLVTGCGKETPPTIDQCEPYRAMYESNGKLIMLGEVSDSIRLLPGVQLGTPTINEIAGYFKITIREEAKKASEVNQAVADFLEEEFNVTVEL